MYKLTIIFLGVLSLIVVGSATGQRQEAAPAVSPAATALPPSLDALYPPNADRPVFLLAMFELGTLMSGTIGDFLDGDFANAEQGYTSFQEKYARLSQMVPEWRSELPAAPIAALGEALRSRDPAKFMPAAQGAGQVCHTCHVKNMARVQQKYHWGDFAGIMLTDPVSKQEVPYVTFMQMLDGDLAGVGVDLSQGQVDKAREHVVALATRYVTLRESCAACHQSERQYYVDAGILGLVDGLGAAMAAASPDPAAVRNALQGIGMESCHNCHLVHAPAALAKHSLAPAQSERE